MTGKNLLSLVNRQQNLTDAVITPLTAIREHSLQIDSQPLSVMPHLFIRSAINSGKIIEKVAESIVDNKLVELCGRYDLYSRFMQERIIFVFNEINDDLAQSVIAQMLLLEAQDPSRDIYLYINSPGGSVTSGMAIYDTMRHLKCDVNTICVGMAASMGAFLLAGGTKGKRFSLENSEIMIHQVLGGARGQASDVEIAARNIRRVKDKMNRLLAEMTGRTQEELEHDTDRDNYMDPYEAMEYGIIDSVIKD